MSFPSTFVRSAEAGMPAATATGPNTTGPVPAAGTRSRSTPARGTEPGEGPALRVLVVTESFLPQVNGVTASVCRVLEHLQQAGHAAAVIAASGPESYAGARVHSVPAAPLPGYPGFRVGLGSRRRIVEIMRDFRPDIVHLASPFMLGATAARAARALGIPTVAVYQTDLTGFARRYGFAAAIPALERHLRRVHRSVDRTLAPSTASLAQLARLEIPRLHHWGRGIDLERFSPGLRMPASAWLRTTGGQTVIGYVGRLAREKNLEHLAALQDLPHTQLLVVGDGPLRPQLEQTLHGATFLGARSGDELARIMASLDVFVHPGAEETFCQSAQEALASGVPVVGPASGGLLDRVQPGCNGLLYAPDDLDGLREAVAELLDPELRRRLALRARPSVEGRSWRVVNDELIGHYRAVIREAGPVLAGNGRATGHKRRPHSAPAQARSGAQSREAIGSAS